MKFSPALANLIEALRCLPGVGPKSAQRMTLHLLERDREGAAVLATALQEAVDKFEYGRTAVQIKRAKDRKRFLAEIERMDEDTESVLHHSSIYLDLKSQQDYKESVRSNTGLTEKTSSKRSNTSYKNNLIMTRN